MRKSRALLVSLLVSLSLCACSVPLVSVTCLCKARGETKSAALYGTEPDAGDGGAGPRARPETYNVFIPLHGICVKERYRVRYFLLLERF